MTRTPTPQELADGLRDLGYGYTAELEGMPAPDPMTGSYVVAHAKRIPSRVSNTDPRLAVFAPWTDRDGYVWIPDLGEVLSQAARGHWSLERFLTGLCAAIVRRDPPSAEDLEEMADDRRESDRMRAQGWRLRYADQHGTAIYTTDSARPGAPEEPA